MCDIGSGWDVIARIPGALTFAAAVGVFLSPSSFPGGSVRFLIGLVTVAVLARAIKLLCMHLSSEAEWAMRPRMDGLPASPGFPSSHTLVMSFAAVAFVYDAIVQKTRRRYAFATIFCVLAVLVAVSRYVQHCHSAAQIACGAAIGVATGGVFAWATGKRA